MAKKTPTPKKNGRPSKYTKALAIKICARLATGQSMKRVSMDEKMPALSTLFLWLANHKEFSELYAQAKAESADAMAEEILDISDDGTNDWIEKELIDKKTGEVYDTIEVFNHEHVQRSKLRVDTRKFLMAKMKPKKYGEKLDLTSDGEKLATLPITGMKVTFEK